MIRAWKFSDPEGRTEIALDEIRVAPGDERALVWVDVESPTPEELKAVAAALGMDPGLADLLAHGARRTRLDRFGDQSVVSVRSCHLEGDELHTRPVDLVFAPGWFASLRHPDQHVLPFEVDRIEELFLRQRREHGWQDEGVLLWAAFDLLVDRYFNVIETFDSRLDRVEDQVFDQDHTNDTPREIFVLRRSMVEFRRAVSPLREVVAALLRREVPTIGEIALAHLQDTYDHVLRVTDLIESQRELLTGLLEASLAVASNRMNRVMKLTSSWGAIILGSTLIAGIYGMNFEHMPELHWVLGYPLALLMMLALTLVLYRVFRRKGWL